MTTPAPLDKTLYTAHASALGGREGRVKSDDGTLEVGPYSNATRGNVLVTLKVA